MSTLVTANIVAASPLWSRTARWLLGSLFVLAVLSASECWSAEQPVPEDRYGHYIVYYGVGAASSGTEHLADTSLVVALVPGILKELYDSTQPGNRFDPSDLASDALGLALGAATGGTVILHLSGPLFVMTFRF